MHVAKILLRRQQYVVGLIYHKTTLLSAFQPFTSWDLQAFLFATLLPLSSLYGRLGLLCPTCKEFLLPGTPRSLPSPYFSLSRSLRRASLCSSTWTAPHNVVPCTNSQIMPSLPLSELSEMLNLLAAVSTPAGWILHSEHSPWSLVGQQLLLLP